MLSAVIFIAAKDLRLFLNLRRLTHSATQIVKLSAANLRLAEYYYLIYVGRMKGESLFNTYTGRNASYGKGFGDSAAVLSDNSSLEELNSLFLTLGDTNVNLYTVTNAKLRNLSFKLLIYKSLDLFHFMALLYTTNIRAEHCRGLF